MVSTTATQLASNRRKLRLAHHRRAASPGLSAPNGGLGGAGGIIKGAERPRRECESPAPSPTLTAASSTGTPTSAASSSAASSSPPSPAARRRGARNDAGGGGGPARGPSSGRTGGGRPQRPQPPDPPSRHGATGSRGRSRRSRAATRRGGNDEASDVHQGGARADDAAAEQAGDHRRRELALDLRAADSADSDDSGTCFDSIGTATPRQTSPRRAHAAARSARAAAGATGDGPEPYQPVLTEGEPRAPEDAIGPRPRLLPAKTKAGGRGKAADGALSPLHEDGSGGGGSGPNPDFDSIWDHPEALVSASGGTTKHRAPAERGGAGYPGASYPGGGGGGDAPSAAYSEFDRDSRAGSSHRGAARRGGGVHGRREREVLARRQLAARDEGGGGGGASVESSRYGDAKETYGDHKSVATQGKEGEGEETALFDRPNVKTALGVGAAATLGAVILGPVGLLVGAASVGIGLGVMQIPEEQRNNVQKRASASLEKARDIACDVSDQLNTSCARHTGTNPKELAERAVPDEIVDACCYAVPEEGEARGGGGAGGRATGDDGHSLSGDPRATTEARSEGKNGHSPIANAVDGMGREVNKLVGEVFGDDGAHRPGPTPPMAATGAGGGGERGPGAGAGGEAGAPTEGEHPGRRVACGRKGRVVPLGQIHSLRPSLQPRAWLDVMASAHTSRDDKNEALQEILILVKDKEISRWFLEEGILDSLMFILSNYFRNYSSFLRKEIPAFGEGEAEPFSAFKPGGNAFYHARLAANCCVALGKAHCAAVHTEGDLLLMSAYSRGSVPVERQLAQMLFEVPHHIAQQGGEFEAEFTLTELSMQQAEDLASSIKALDDGKIDV